MTSTLATS